MFNCSYLRACMKLRIVQKIRFSLHESVWSKAWCPCLVSGPSAKAQDLVARIRKLVIQPQKLSVGVYFDLSFQGCGFLIHLFQQVRQPSISSPVEEDTPKIQDTTGTVFIQGPSIVLLLWRSITFNGSFLRVCRILQFVKKLDFPFMSLGGPRHGALVWCLGRVPKHRNQLQELEGLLFSPQNSQLVHILSFRSQVSWCIF